MGILKSVLHSQPEEYWGNREGGKPSQREQLGPLPCATARISSRRSPPRAALLPPPTLGIIPPASVGFTLGWIFSFVFCCSCFVFLLFCFVSFKLRTCPLHSTPDRFQHPPMVNSFPKSDNKSIIYGINSLTPETFNSNTIASSWQQKANGKPYPPKPHLKLIIPD